MRPLVRSSAQGVHTAYRAGERSHRPGAWLELCRAGALSGGIPGGKEGRCRRRLRPVENDRLVLLGIGSWGGCGGAEYAGAHVREDFVRSVADGT